MKQALKLFSRVFVNKKGILSGIKLIFIVIVIISCLSGCGVSSLHPFYEEENITYSEKVLGAWMDQDSNRWVFHKFYYSTDDGTERVFFEKDFYTVGFYSGRNCINFDLVLFELEGQMYADICPPGFGRGFTSHMLNFQSIQTHSLAKVNIKGEQIEITGLNIEWLYKLIAQNRIRISHEIVPSNELQKIFLPYTKEGSYLLTAATDELQKFIIKYNNDPDAFKKVSKKLEKQNSFRYEFIIGNGVYGGKFAQVDPVVLTNHFVLNRTENYTEQSTMDKPEINFSNELIVEALIDGNTELIVQSDGIYWKSKGVAKPGKHNDQNEPTLINGKKWYPVWGIPYLNRGFDNTNLCEINIGDTKDLKFELLSVGKRGKSGIEQRDPIKMKHADDKAIILISDSQSGSRWYKIKIYK